MAVTETIQELLQGIDDAQYGRDMRQYIHKGIQKCYEEGSAGETDLTARTEIQNVRDEMVDNLGNIANVELTSTASKIYKVGEKLIYNNVLYKVTSDIAYNGTIVPGTNVIATNVGDELFKIGECKEYYAWDVAITPPVSKYVLVESDTVPAGTYLIFAQVRFGNTSTDYDCGIEIGRGSTSGTFTMFAIAERGNGKSRMFTPSGCVRLTASDTIQLRVSNAPISTTYSGVFQLVKINDRTT